jgi:hypothetical protein
VSCITLYNEKIITAFIKCLVLSLLLPWRVFGRKSLPEATRWKRRMRRLLGSSLWYMPATVRCSNWAVLRWA